MLASNYSATFTTEQNMLFSLSIHLENHDIDNHVRPKGPLFNRWLPNGRSDSIILTDSIDIEVWFERRGYVDRSFIRYDKKKNEVDPKIMALQGKLDAGQLWGEIEYSDISENELDAVLNNKIDSDEYISLGKRLVKTLHPPLSNFINKLRTQYGQYWLPELSPWDSRSESLGSYCSTTIWLEWSNDDRKT